MQLLRLPPQWEIQARGSVFSPLTAFRQKYLSRKIKESSLWLSHWSCLGLLTRGWGLPAEFLTACLHEYRRNTSSTTHGILILLSSPSLLPPLSWYVTELIVKTDYTCIIKAGLPPRPPFVPSSDQQDYYCSTGEHIWTVEPKLGGRTSATAHSQCCRNATHWPELWKDPMLGSGHIWISLSVENSAHLPPLPPPRTSARAGSQDPLITAHQGNDIIAHWQGYLSGDREILEG